ncbi:NUDIX hydrolase [Corynebacterium sp. LK2510]
MTDNTRPSSGDSQGAQHDGRSRRRRRRRGSRASGKPGATQPKAENGSSSDSASGAEGSGKSAGKGSGKGAGKGSPRGRRRGRGREGRDGRDNRDNRDARDSRDNKDKPKGSSGRGRGRPGRGRPNAKGGNRQATRHRQNPRNPRHSAYADSTMETRDETSAGGLVVSGMAEAVNDNGRVDLSQIYVALIGRLDRRGRLLWSMPKGHVEPGEHQWRTAEREVWEETGIHGEAFDTLGVIDYWFVSDGVRIHKTVHHNLLRFVDGILNDDDPEVTEVTWVPMSELIERLAYADERKLARIAFDRMPELARKEAAAGRFTPR